MTVVSLALYAVECVPGAAFASDDPAAIARKMIDQNGAVAAIRAKWVIGDTTPVSDSDVARSLAQFDSLREKGDAEQDASVDRLKDIYRKEIVDGRHTSTFFFDGVINREGRYHATLLAGSAKVRKLLPDIIIFAKDNGLRFSQETGLAVLTGPPDKAPELSAKNYDVSFVTTWMDRIAQLETVDKITKVGDDKHNGHACVILEQAPTPFTFDTYVIRSWVDPEEGYVPYRTEFREQHSDQPIRVIESSNCKELAPGVWRPLKCTDTRYEIMGGKSVFSSQATLDFTQVSLLSKEECEAQLIVKVPRDAATVVDRRPGRGAGTQPSSAVDPSLSVPGVGDHGVASVRQYLRERSPTTRPQK